MNTVELYVANWLRREVTAAGARGLIVGLAGDIDSAVVARLCQMAAPTNTVGVILPCHRDPDDEANAFLVADHFGIPTVRIDLALAYEDLLGGFQSAFAGLPAGHVPVPAPDEEDRPSRKPMAKVKPRLRMTALHFVAASLRYLVAGTLNRSQLTIGRFTKYGDGGVDLLPLGRLTTSEVRVLAGALDIPAAILDAPPGSRLRMGDTPDPATGFTDEHLENYLVNGPDFVAPALAMRIERLVRSTDHKRALPPMPDEDA
jgi:NAD+ synthase